MSDRALVTGGAGFIGSHLVDHLVRLGKSVTVIDDFSTGYLHNLTDAQAQGDVRIVPGSILNPTALDAALADCNHIYHLAVQCVRRSLGRPLQNHEINATGTLHLLEAARRRRVERFLYCSSSEVYGDAGSGTLNESSTVCQPTTVYGAAKLAGENYAKAYHRAYGVPTVVVRPFNAYGTREHDRGDLAEVIPRFAIRILNGLPPVMFGNGSNARDFTFVTDTARGLAMAMTCDKLVGREVNIASGRVITVREVAEIILRLCQREDLTPVQAGARPGDIHTLRADTRLATEALGFAATMPFEQGIEHYLSWFARTYPDPSLLLKSEVQNWTMPPDNG